MPFSEWCRSHPVTPVTLAEARREWQKFQADIHILHGRPSWLVRLLPVGTRRHRWVRLLVAPLLHDSPRQRFSPHESPLAISGLRAPAVEILRLDSLSIDEANVRMRESTTTWVMFAGPSDAEADLLQLAAVLEEYSPSSREVVLFAGDGSEGSPFSVGVHTLLSYNAVGRGALFPRELIVRSGGLASCVDPEHDLVIRLSEMGVSFHGVPLQHSLENAPSPHPSTTQRALRRRGITAEVLFDGDVLQWTVPGTPTVDVVIPTRDRLDLLTACISSIEQRCGNFAVTITIVDNDSHDVATRDYLANTPHRVVHHPGPFNYAQIVNHGVSEGRHDVVIVLNNDTIVSDGWLEALVPLATLPDVGVVGATLVSPEGSVQHAGMAAVPYPVELPYGSVHNLRTNEEVQLSRQQATAIRNVVAVTGACHVIERSKWEKVGGMDESLAVIGNDVDLCLRLAEIGHYTVLQPHVTITHVGKASRGANEPMEDHVRFLARWPFLTELRDPFVPRRRRAVAS
ncbi:MAG: glycosyltransferase [Acidobacteria bacterium]|nr:glycosyltransferase [Acidobacteriota bacterium]